MLFLQDKTLLFMKKHAFYLILTMALAGLWACTQQGTPGNKDEQGQREEANPIVGTWVCNDPVNYADGSVRDYTETYVFNSDGTMSIQFICEDLWDDHWTFGVRFAGTYTADGSKFSFKAHMVAVYDGVDGKYEWQAQEQAEEVRDCAFEYNIDGNKMTVNYGQESAIFGHGGSAVMVYTKQ